MAKFIENRNGRCAIYGLGGYYKSDERSTGYDVTIAVRCAFPAKAILLSPRWSVTYVCHCDLRLKGSHCHAELVMNCAGEYGYVHATSAEQTEIMSAVW